MKTHTIAAPLIVLLGSALQGLAAEEMQRHSHTNFTISLPSKFVRQPQKGYSDPFLFGAEKVFLSFQLVVTTNTPLAEMTNIDVMDVIFRSSAEYPRQYVGLRAVTNAKGWISFVEGKREHPARFRIVSRQKFPVPKAKTGERVTYEIQREAIGYWEDAEGRSRPGPMETTKAIACVVDAGPRKFVFFVFKVTLLLDDNMLKEIESGLSAFEEIAEPPTGGDAVPRAPQQ